MTGFTAAETFEAAKKLVQNHGGRKLYLVAAGAGAGIGQLVWQAPGASAFLIESSFPYHRGAVDCLLGRSLKSYSSENAAVALASAGYAKAQEALWKSGEDFDPSKIVAIGAAASVATSVQRRGSDRIHIAIREQFRVRVAGITFEKGFGDRAFQGQLCDGLIMNAALLAFEQDQIPLGDWRMTSAEIQGCKLAPRDLIYAPQKLPVMISADGEVSPLSNHDLSGSLIVCGSFNPLHFGHEQMAQIAAIASGRQVVFELSAANAEKPGFDLSELYRRALQFRGRHPIMLASGAPLFIDKARLYKSAFAIGADTAQRLLDPKYLPQGVTMDQLLAEFRSLGTRFYVLGRQSSNGGFTSAENFDASLRDLFLPLPGRWDVSSSDIRKRQP